MARPTKPAHEVHSKPVEDAKDPATEPKPADPLADEQPAESKPKEKVYTVKVGQIQRCVFHDKTTWDALPGSHEVTDEKLIQNLRNYCDIPGVHRCIEIHEPK